MTEGRTEGWLEMQTDPRGQIAIEGIRTSISKNNYSHVWFTRGGGRSRLTVHFWIRACSVLCTCPKLTWHWAALDFPPAIFMFVVMVTIHPCYITVVWALIIKIVIPVVHVCCYKSKRCMTMYPCYITIAWALVVKRFIPIIYVFFQKKGNRSLICIPVIQPLFWALDVKCFIPVVHVCC